MRRTSRSLISTHPIVVRLQDHSLEKGNRTFLSGKGVTFLSGPLADFFPPLPDREKSGDAGETPWSCPVHQEYLPLYSPNFTRSKTYPCKSLIQVTLSSSSTTSSLSGGSSESPVISSSAEGSR